MICVQHHLAKLYIICFARNIGGNMVNKITARGIKFGNAAAHVHALCMVFMRFADWLKPINTGINR